MCINEVDLTQLKGLLKEISEKLEDTRKQINQLGSKVDEFKLFVDADVLKLSEILDMQIIEYMKIDEQIKSREDRKGRTE